MQDYDILGRNDEKAGIIVFFPFYVEMINSNLSAKWGLKCCKSKPNSIRKSIIQQSYQNTFNA